MVQRLPSSAAGADGRWAPTVDLETALRRIAFGEEPRPPSPPPARQPRAQLSEHEQEERRREVAALIAEDWDDPTADADEQAAWERAGPILVYLVQTGLVRENSAGRDFWGNVGDDITLLPTHNRAIRNEGAGPALWKESPSLAFVYEDVKDVCDDPLVLANALVHALEAPNIAAGRDVQSNLDRPRRCKATPRAFGLIDYLPSSSREENTSFATHRPLPLLEAVLWLMDDPALEGDGSAYVGADPKKIAKRCENDPTFMQGFETATAKIFDLIAGGDVIAQGERCDGHGSSQGEERIDPGFLQLNPGACFPLLEFQIRNEWMDAKGFGQEDWRYRKVAVGRESFVRAIRSNSGGQVAAQGNGRSNPAVHDAAPEREEALAPTGEVEASRAEIERTMRQVVGELKTEGSPKGKTGRVKVRGRVRDKLPRKHVSDRESNAVYDSFQQEGVIPTGWSDAGRPPK